MAAASVTEIYANAIPIDGPAGRGVHLSWLGPAGLLHAPGGWRIERRDAGRTRETCEVVTAAQVKGADELRLDIGVLTVSPGTWPGPEGGACQVWTILLDGPTAGIHGTITGPQAFVYGLRHGAAAAFAGPLSGRFDLGAAPIDRLVIYLRFTFSADMTLRLCRFRYDTGDWAGGRLLATLQLPMRELMPALADADAEFGEAKSRLLPGERLDPRRFAEFIDMIRPIALSPGQPIQRALLVRTVPDDEYDEMDLLDPLRMVFASPMWRRVLGLSFFDRDPALVAGQAYDYRITALLPGDAAAPFYGFHTIPSGTALPAEFYLHDCHVRLAAPVAVARAPDVPQTGLLVSTRRGIPLVPRQLSGWAEGLIEHYSIVIDLPAPASKIEFVLARDHDLVVEGGSAWGPFSTSQPLPPGERTVVSFAVPVTQLRLTGKGFLFSIHPLDGGSPELAPVATIVAGVRLVDTPLPPPPINVQARNLQGEAQLTTQSAALRPPRHRLGMRVRWEPALAAGLSTWPATLNTPPPLDATAFQIERRTEPAGPWQPILAGDNLMLGSRDAAPRDTAIRPGSDLMQIYPETSSAGGGSNFSYQDVFLAPDPADPLANRIPQPPPPGTMLRYRARAIDFIGRPSADWTESDPARLEKHEPPPPPAAPDDQPADPLADAAPTGVHARILIRDDPDMSAGDRALLGTSDNAVVLRWGWHAKQRRLDPYATHFRLYASEPLDEVAGTLVSASTDPARPGVFKVRLQLARAVPADAAKGLYLEAGHPFFVEGHNAGNDIVATVRTVIAAPGGGFHTPPPGAIRLPLRYSPGMTRPRGWQERLSVVPITAAERYEAVIRDRLTLTADHPRDTLWLGVSAADDQAYIADTFTGPSPGGALPGNESAVAAMLCQGRRLTRPVLQPALPTGPVPRLITREPGDGPVRCPLDLGPYLAAANIAPGTRLQIDRVHAVDLLASFGTAGGALVAKPADPRSGEAGQPIAWGNPAEQSAVAAALDAGDFEGVDDRFLILLAQLYPWRDRLFQSAVNAPIPTAAFDETLPSASARYLYAVRTADPAGRLSEAAMIAHVVLRVPSPMPGPAPVMIARRIGDPAASLRCRVPENARLAHLLTFRLPLDDATAYAGGVVLRVPNRPDLAPGAAIRLRLDDGAILTPAVLPLAELEHDAQGWQVLVGPAAPQTGPVRIWLCTLTGDGVPSPLAGPATIPFIAPPPPVPILSGSATADGVRLTWLWPDGAVAPAVVERSADGTDWTRISPPLGTRTSFDTPATPHSSQYRVAVRTPGGQSAVSNVVTL